MNPQTKVSVGQNIENLYEEIFNEIYPEIKQQKKGVLSKVIYTISEADNSEVQKNCQYLKVGDYALLDDDSSISTDIIGLFVSNPNEKKQWIDDMIVQPVKKGIKNVRKNLANNLEPNDMKLFQIVVIGCMIVGVGVCRKYLEKAKKEREREANGSPEIQPSDSYPLPPKEPVPVALCLVVPASVVRNLRNNYQIDVSDIANLIDNSLYFLCTIPEDANATQRYLELTEEDITTVSDQREIYVRVDIADGENMMNKKVPYILKRNLPANAQSEVKKLACLKYLSVSGLEKFNRV